jgi:8-oxo-dGTP pyrophosphatase MutT (NUDIX family)
LKDWPNEWVRFTDYEDLTIAKQPYHMDPAGLYFFPKSFQQMGVWHTENKYVVTIRLKPEAKVLDLGGISETEMRDILNKLNIQYKDDKKIDPYKFWMKIRENYIGKQVKFSNELRKIGYDAVFDDTKSIHGVEKQLLVLRPKYIEVLSVKKVAKFTDILREMDKVVRNEFSGWSATKAEIKNKTQWGEKTKVLAYELSKGKLKIEVEITHSAIRSRSKEKIPSDVTARFYVGGKNNYDQSWDRDLIKFSLSGNSKYDSQKEKLFVEIYNYNLDDFKLKIKKLNEITSEKDHSIYTDKEGKHWGQQGAGGLFYCPATGRYLVSHRSLLVNEPNTWGTWGGKIDENESPEEALKREIKEETGYKGTYSLKHIYTYTDNDFKFYNYIIEVPEEFEPNHSWETQGHEWVTLNDMPQPMHYGLKALIPYLAKKQNPTKEENPVSSIEGHKFVSTKTIQNYGYRFLLRQSFQRPIVRQETFINIKNNKKEIIEKFKNSLENSEYELDPYANLLFNIFGKKDFYPKKGTPQFRKVYGHYSVSDFDKLNKEDKEEIVKYIKEFIDEIENPNKKINLKEDKHLHIKILDPQFFYEIYGIDFLNQLKNTEKIEINGTNRKVQHDLVEVCIAEEEWRLAILKRKFERFSKLLSKKQNPLSLIAKGFDERPASSYDREELKKGIKTELEHTDDAIIASKIAKDHLDEDPHYYTKLLKMENPLGVRDYHPSKDEIATYNAAYSKWIEDCYSEIKKFCEKYKLWYKVHRPRAGYSHYIAIYKNSVASVDEPNLPYYPLAIRLSTHPEKRPYTEYKDFDLSLVFKIDPKGDFSADYHDDNNQLKKDYVSTNSTKELHKFLWGIDMYERKKQYKKANPDSINLVKEYQKYVEILLKDYIDTHLIAEGVDKDPENFKRLVKEKKESYVPKLSFILDVVVYGHSDNFINLLIDAVEENTTELSNILTSFDKDFVEFIKSRGEDVFYREANKNLKIYIYEHDGDTDIKSEKYLSIGTDFIKFIKYLMDSGKIRDTRKLLNPITSVSKKSKVKMWSRMKKHNPYGKCNCFSCSRKKEQNDNGDISIENLERLIEESRRIIKALELKRESAREERDSYKYLWNDRGNERDYDKAEELDEKVQEYYYSIEFEKSRLEDFLERLKVKKSNPVTSNSEKSEEYLPVIQETVAGIDKGLDVWIDEKNNDIVIGTMAFEEDRSFDDILVRIKTNGRIIEGEDVDNSIKKYTQNLMKKVHKDLAEYVTKKPNPSKFQKLVKKLETKGAEDPKALAAWIGRQKYGEKKFQQMAEKGKKKIQAKRK